MSSAVYCDCCKKEGRRRMGFPAPEGWFFLEAKNDDAPDPEVTTLIVSACSPKCALGLWTKCGPESRWKPEDYAILDRVPADEDDAGFQNPPPRVVDA